MIKASVATRTRSTLLTSRRLYADLHRTRHLRGVCLQHGVHGLQAPHQPHLVIVIAHMSHNIGCPPPRRFELLTLRETQGELLSWEGEPAGRQYQRRTEDRPDGAPLVLRAKRWDRQLAVHDADGLAVVRRQCAIRGGGEHVGRHGHHSGLGHLHDCHDHQRQHLWDVPGRVERHQRGLSNLDGREPRASVRGGSDRSRRQPAELDVQQRTRW
jgi:hypothetical protein